MVLPPLSVTVPSASSFSPVLHHNLVLLSLESLLDFMKLTSSRNMHFVVVIEASSATSFLPNKKKNPPLFLLLFFFYLFGFIHFSFLNGVWGGRRTYMFSMVCFRKEDGSTLAVPWLGVASNWSHSRLWLLHQPLGLREHLKYLNRRQNRAFQMFSESSNIAQNCILPVCVFAVLVGLRREILPGSSMLSFTPEAMSSHWSWFFKAVPSQPVL